MDEKTNAEGWVWVIVYDREQDGHYLGLHDDDKDVDFIPAFVSKDAAGDCYLNLPRQPGTKYEIQAIHIEELLVDAQRNEFAVVVIDGDGAVVEQHGIER